MNDASARSSASLNRIYWVLKVCRPEIRALLDRGNYFADHPTDSGGNALRSKIIVNLFYENSTRTRTSFRLAAKRLGGSVLNIAVAGYSVKKAKHC